MAKAEQLEIEGRTIAVSNPGKVLYPQAGFTKGQVIDYYIRVSDWLLPHLKDRPVTLKRYPDGVSGEFFYEKDAPGFTPAWVRTFPVPRRGGGPDIRYVVIDDLATLVWCANLANLEIHPFLHRVPDLERPSYVVFDLDPGAGATVLECARVALLIRGVLERFQLESFVKVSGSKGLQLYVPLNSPAAYDATGPFARGVAQLLEREHPRLAVAEMAKAARQGKVFIDWSQNSDYKTTVGVYSLRAKRQTPFVSLPVRWDELQRALRTGDSGMLYFQPAAALARLEQAGDLFAPVLSLRQRLPAEVFAALGAGVKSPPARAVRHAAAGPRRGRQGSHRRFVLEDGALRLEIGDVLKSWRLPRRLPGSARVLADQPLDSLEPTGTYEVVEGSYASGRLRVYLEGQGEWRLERAGDSRWRVARIA